MVQRTLGIVFDLDETLYDQGDFKRSSFRAVGRYLEEKGLARSAAVEESLEGIIRLHGPSGPRMIDMMIKELNLSLELVPTLVEVFRSNEPEISVFPGVFDLLTALGQKMPLGLLTDGLGRIQRGKVKALGVAPYFKEILFSDDLGTSKPDPRLFEWFEERFNLPGEALLYVGDNPEKDFFGARGRGWRTIRVMTGEYSKLTPNPGFAADIEISHVLNLQEHLD